MRLNDSATEVRAVTTRRERKLFYELPTRLFRNDPAFVPALDQTFSLLLDRRRNPFWRHAEGQEWIAWRNGEPVGRIGACKDEDLLSRNPGLGAVGFFECGDDSGAADSLFRTAFEWLSARGLTRARGPLNYSIHDTAGLLVDGFDTPATIDTTWNPAFYPALWEEAGFSGIQDLLGAGGELEIGGPNRAKKFGELARKRGVTVRPLDFSRYAEEVDAFRVVYNAAWDDNWGHVPISSEEFAFKAKDMKAVLDPDLVRMAEKDGKPVGFMLGLPDLNVAIRKSRGRLLPFGWWRLLRARKTCKRVRVMAMGVVPGSRRRGVEALLMSDSFQAIGARYAWCEASWVLADNAAMVNGLALYNLHPYKRWRLYEKTLTS